VAFVGDWPEDSESKPKELWMRITFAASEGVPYSKTGGLADVLSGESRAIQHVDANLTLDGLRLIWERHSR